jgi:hypothetical protein
MLAALKNMEDINHTVESASSQFRYNFHIIVSLWDYLYLHTWCSFIFLSFCESIFSTVFEGNPSLQFPKRDNSVIFVPEIKSPM